MDKKILRKEMIRKRDELSPLEIQNLSEKVISRVIESDIYKNSKNIFTFVSFKSEVFTHNFIKNSILNGKKIFIPHIIDKTMHPVELKDFKDLEIGFYNILSMPEDKIKISKGDEIDLVIVPGLIFGKNMYRIGYGGGYYDKFLSNKEISAYKLGICYDFQVIDEIQNDIYDIPVDKIITDKRIIERIWIWIELKGL